MQPASLEIAIRDLVDSPDLALDRVESSTRAHSRAHAYLRRKYKSYQSEITLRADIPGGDSPTRITGRIDGFRRTRDGIQLIEIKTVPGDPGRWIGSPLLEAARWQLRLYADLARSVSDAPWGSRRVQSATLFLIGERETTAEEVVSLAQCGGLLRRRLDVLRHTAAARNLGSRESLPLERFIGDDLKSDRALQAAAWQSLSTAMNASRILLSIPPGCGKTRLALRYGLLLAFRSALPLHWITSKSRGRDEVLAELSRYAAAGIPLRVVWKTSAERLCSCVQRGASCETRQATNRLLFERGVPELEQRGAWTPDDIAGLASAQSLCPHALSQELEQTADVVIADLNYVIERSSLWRRNAVVILDEAQNIAARLAATSEVHLPARVLRGIVRSLPRSAGSRCQHVCSAEWWNTTESEVRRDQWISFSRTVETCCERSEWTRMIARSARFWEAFPAGYVMQWYRADPKPGPLGALVRFEAATKDILFWSNCMLALSGSLPHDAKAVAALCPGMKEFTVVGIPRSAPPPIAIVPCLEFKHPLTLQDHQCAEEALIEVRREHGPCVAVFGQNRASNDVLANRLRVRGHVVMVDEDVTEGWDSVAAVRPDFFLIALSGKLAESVNPPPQLFSAGAILSPGHLPPTPFDALREAVRTDAENWRTREDDARDRLERTALAVSRVIQAAGRLQRSSERMAPVYLLNRDFAREDYLRSWPRDWYAQSATELVCATLHEAIQRICRAEHAQ